MNRWVVVFKLLIKKFREQRNLSQDELANLASISQGFLNEIEHGQKTPSLFTLEKIANALKINLDELIRGDIKFPREKIIKIKKRSSE